MVDAWHVVDKDGNHLYKPISERAKEAMKVYLARYYDGWYPFGALGLKPVFDFACVVVDVDGDIEETLVPLPVRPVHRYEVLGYTPHKWGEHDR